MDDIVAMKRSMRRETVGRILAMAPERRFSEEAELVSKFPTLPGWTGANRVLLYAKAFPEEISTEPLLRLTLEAGKRLVCPRVDRRAKGLQLFEIQDLDADFEEGTLAIPEPKRTCPEVAPSEVDWVLVPGLAFDERGYRLGRGAGHYDRLLPRLRAEVPCWALILDAQWVEKVPVEPHDLPLDGVASTSRISWPSLQRKAVPRSL